MDDPTLTSDGEKTGEGTQAVIAPAVITASKDKEGRIQYDGKKWVPESDLLAVKKGLGEQLESAKSVSSQAITDLKTTSDQHYQASLAEKTAKEAVEAKLIEANAKVEDIEKLRTGLANATTSREQLEPKLLDLKKANLGLQYGVTEAQLDGKNLEQLNTLEEALKLVGPSKARNYDISGGGGGSADGTPFAAEIAELAEAKSKK